MRKTVPARNQRNSSRKKRKQQHLLDVKVRSRAATRQRNRSVLAWFSALLLFCGAIGGIVYGGREALRRFFWQNPDYNLAEVAIHTDGSLTRDQIIEATNIHEGRNIFTINLAAARKGLIGLPQVDRAEVERILPNKISIEITERKPVAWVAAKDDGDPSADPGAFLIDRDGILIRVKRQVPDYFHLPVICGFPVDNYEEGETVDLPEVKAALNLIRLTGENPARYQVRSINVSKGYCLVVTDERHASVTFPLENLEAQIDHLQRIFANIDPTGREIQTVNLLVQRNIPVTFVPLPDPEPAGDDAATPPVSPSPAPQPASAAAGSTSTSRRGQFLTGAGHSSSTTTRHTPQTVHKTSTTTSHHPHIEPVVRRAIPVTATDTQP